jgi:hypothetical protein
MSEQSAQAPVGDLIQPGRTSSSRPARRCEAMTGHSADASGACRT